MFKVGDRVRCIIPGHSFYNWVGRVEAIYEACIEILFDGMPYNTTWSDLSGFVLEAQQPTLGGFPITFELTPPKVQSRECPCGIFRGDCTYHA